MLVAGLSGMILVVAVGYWYLTQEIVVFESNTIDGHGSRVVVTCRADEMFTYYPYVKIVTASGTEVARAQISGRGYEASEACRHSYPVTRLELIPQSSIVKVHFKGRNAFGDAEMVEIPVRYFSVR
jgi:hypothetical protein